MAVTKLQAEAAIKALTEMSTNMLAGKMAGHAFTDHMSRSNATKGAARDRLAAQVKNAEDNGNRREDIVKGYYEKRVTSSVPAKEEFDKLKERVRKVLVPGYDTAKDAQRKRRLITNAQNAGKSYEHTAAITENDMALIIQAGLKASAPDLRQGRDDRFVLFTPVPSPYVSRSIDHTDLKTGKIKDLPWSALIIRAGGAQSVIIIAFPTDETYRLRTGCL